MTSDEQARVEAVSEFTVNEIRRIVEEYLRKEREYLAQLEQEQHDNPNIRAWKWRRTERELRQVERALASVQAKLTSDTARGDGGGEVSEGGQ